jgi:hypothetical protein
MQVFCIYFIFSNFHPKNLILLLCLWVGHVSLTILKFLVTLYCKFCELWLIGQLDHEYKLYIEVVVDV